MIMGLAAAAGGKLEGLLTPDFIQAHTRYGSVDAWFEASPFKLRTTEDFEAIPEAEWDDYVRTTSDFESWRALLDAARKQYIRAKLFG